MSRIERDKYNRAAEKQDRVGSADSDENHFKALTVIVPTEPTPAMLGAALMAWLNYDTPEDCEWEDGVARAIWAAMLKAANE